MKGADRNVPSDRWWIFKAAALVVLGICAGLLTLEGAYRGYRFVKYGSVDFVTYDSLGYFVPDPTYGYSPAKGFNSATVPEAIRQSVYGRDYNLDMQFTVNSLGYRGKEFTVAKPPGTFRIVTFGGSTTMAMETNDAETWSAQLEVQLNQAPAFLQRHGVQRVEVINAAVKGWRSVENLLRLQKEIQFFEPDLLLIASTWNDFIDGTEGEDTVEPTAGRSVFRNGIPWWGHSQVGQNLRVRYLNYAQRAQTTMEQYSARLRRDEPWVETYEGNLLKMQAIASDIGAQVIIVSLPGLCRTTAPVEERTLVVNQPWALMIPATYPFWADLKAFAGSVLRDFGQETNVQVIDVHDRFESFGGAERLEMFDDNVHMNARGHRETAQVIRQAMEPSS